MSLFKFLNMWTVALVTVSMSFANSCVCVSSGQCHWIDGSPHGSCFSVSLAADILKFTCLGAECVRVSGNLLKLCLGTQLSYLETLSGFALGFLGGSGPRVPRYCGKTCLRGQQPVNPRVFQPAWREWAVPSWVRAPGRVPLILSVILPLPGAVSSCGAGLCFGQRPPLCLLVL